MEGKRGLLFSFEGLPGAGCRTQLQKLASSIPNSAVMALDGKADCYLGDFDSNFKNSLKYRVNMAYSDIICKLSNNNSGTVLVNNYSMFLARHAAMSERKDILSDMVLDARRSMFLAPDLTFYFSISSKIAFERKKPDFEIEHKVYLKLLERAKVQYDSLADLAGKDERVRLVTGDVRVIDAERSVDEVFKDVERSAKQ